jgi:hypothetical protein
LKRGFGISCEIVKERITTRVKECRKLDCKERLLNCRTETINLKGESEVFIAECHEHSSRDGPCKGFMFQISSKGVVGRGSALIGGILFAQ